MANASSKALLFSFCLILPSVVNAHDDDLPCTTPSPTVGSAFTMEPSWLAYILIGILICLSALFSGLTLGLLSLDMNGLRIVIGSGDEKQAKLARAIAPVRENGNLLLCTLLFGNVAVNALLSILMADISGGLLGFLISTFAIVIFGEIIPQATCSRYPLEIGTASLPIVKFMMVLFYIITKPMATLLDKVLGQELGTIYSTQELVTMLKLHEESDVVDKQQSNALIGALQYKDMLVSEVMTPISEAFMLSYDATLSFKMLREIFQTGFSRIPVYGPQGRNEIVGLLFVKDLIFVDPEDETPVIRFVEILARSFEIVEDNDKLGEVLTIFKQGRGHMAIVRGVIEYDDGRDNEYKIKGIVTLEDIVEAILGDEIIDETDQFIHMESRDRVNRQEFDYGRLDLLDSKLNQNHLNFDEVNAIAAHLISNNEVFKKTETGEDIDIHLLKSFISTIQALTLYREGDGMGSVSQIPAKDVIYKRGRASTKLTLVLSGKLSVSAGKDEFKSEAGPWSVLGADAIALEEGTYLPDFTAYIATETVRCIQISRPAYDSYINKHMRKTNNRAPVNREGSQFRRKDFAARFTKVPAGKKIQNSNLNEFEMTSTSGKGLKVNFDSTARGDPTNGNRRKAMSDWQIHIEDSPELKVMQGMKTGKETGNGVFSLNNQSGVEQANRRKAFSECNADDYEENDGAVRTSRVDANSHNQTGAERTRRLPNNNQSKADHVMIDVCDPMGLPPPIGTQGMPRGISGEDINPLNFFSDSDSEEDDKDLSPISAALKRQRLKNATATAAGRSDNPSPNPFEPSPALSQRSKNSEDYTSEKHDTIPFPQL